MVTKIHVNAHHLNSLGLHRKGLDFELQDFYCKEELSVVLENLIDKYYVSHYNSIGLNFFNSYSFKRSDGSKSLICGLGIKEMESKEGLITTTDNSVLSYSPSFVMGQFTKQHFDMIMSNLIRKYLIDVKVLDYGSFIPGSIPRETHVRPSKIIKMGKQEAINYMDSRKNEINSEKEKNLSDLLVYGHVIEDKFNEDSLIKIANKVRKGIPKEFNPQYGQMNISL